MKSSGETPLPLFHFVGNAGLRFWLYGGADIETNMDLQQQIALLIGEVKDIFVADLLKLGSVKAVGAAYGRLNGTMADRVQLAVGQGSYLEIRSCT